MDVSAVGSFDPATLVVIALSLAGLSGVPGLFLRGRTGVGQKIATIALVLAGGIGFPASLACLLSGRTASFTIAWSLPFDPAEIAIDPLSALFLLPVFFVSACAALYAAGYWPSSANRRTEPQLTFFFGIFTAAMALVVVARNGVLFLMAWEAMALSAYFLLAVEHERPEVQRGGLVYLFVTHVGTMALFALFVLLKAKTGSFLFPATASLDAAALPASILFLAALTGFGAKAGIMPLHIWLPEAHANAPSHVSAVMSGVMLKMGVYGLVRFVSLFHTPPLWWGVFLLAAGAASALIGITLAAAQQDLKRVLAMSSIENIGIITIGLGLALIGQATGTPALEFLGMAGALFHILNHSLFKPLLFFGAGAVLHATGTRRIDLMGGLMRRMPYTGALFLLGALAICGLPPLNGFASEFYLYLASFLNATTSAVPVLALVAPLLALIGGLASLTFLKLFGTAFLGAPRDPAAAPHECGGLMLGPMALLAAACLLFGLFPELPAAILEPAMRAWVPTSPSWQQLAGLPPLWWLTGLGLALIALAAVLAGIWRFRLRSGTVGTGTTWGCGYLAPTARMQYTSSSFAEMIVGLGEGVIHPRFCRPAPETLFPAAGRFASHVPDSLLEFLVLPSFRLTGMLFALVRRLQHGKLHLYMLYIFVTLFFLMVWAH